MPMKIVKNMKGKAAGRVSIMGTIATMEVMDTWRVNTAIVDPNYVRVACCKYGAQEGKTFSVSSTVENKDKIVITRTK